MVILDTVKKVLLFNPRAAKHKPRIPNSVLQVAASIDGKYDWAIIDGNREEHPAAKIFHYLRSGAYEYFACTVMPGPQLQQARFAPTRAMRLRRQRSAKRPLRAVWD